MESQVSAPFNLFIRVTMIFLNTKFNALIEFSIFFKKKLKIKILVPLHLL